MYSICAPSSNVTEVVTLLPGSAGIAHVEGEVDC